MRRIGGHHGWEYVLGLRLTQCVARNAVERALLLLVPASVHVLEPWNRGTVSCCQSCHQRLPVQTRSGRVGPTALDAVGPLSPGALPKDIPWRTENS